ncbi:MAG: hypothetical protein OXU66_14870 [Gammaproteobacteria bacterium]|nr:hypothetical protein [Gammaproteobacteria bacterium]
MTNSCALTGAVPPITTCLEHCTRIGITSFSGVRGLLLPLKVRERPPTLDFRILTTNWVYAMLICTDILLLSGGN